MTSTLLSLLGLLLLAAIGSSVWLVRRERRIDREDHARKIRLSGPERRPRLRPGGPHGEDR